MIRVMLIDIKGERSYLEFQRNSPENHGDLTYGLTGTIPAEDAREVAQDVAQGYMSGFTGGYHWYRQAR